jgi:hypothetical protein
MMKRFTVSPQTGARAGTLALCLLLAAACDSTDRLSPPGDPAIPAAPTSVEDGTLPSFAVGSAAPGIVFGSFDLPNSLLGSVHSGAMRTPDPSSIIYELSTARSKGARFILKLSRGSDHWVQNSDGTFSLTKWKQMVDRFKGININSYINEGTVLGHYLIDEPNRAARWGGKVIPQSTIEAMAKYSKQIWPGMPTIVRVVPSWLKQANISYTYLDAAWAQYAAYKGDVTKFITPEVAAAKYKHLGLVVSMNILDGGNGSSGIRGPSSGKYSMSASELKTYGNVLLNQTYACGFLMWMYNSSYFGRSDVKSSMSALASRARSHTKTSCRQ